MFEVYSERANQVIFVARLKAGQRGADMVDVDDILVALIIEDQMMGKQLLELLGRPEIHGFAFKSPSSIFLPGRSFRSTAKNRRAPLPIQVCCSVRRNANIAWRQTHLRWSE
ncbi:MAG: hypothetical protein WAR24_16740 [Candidatus Acidiferrales bacterium]